MTDPWPYARELRVKNALELTEETAMLLADADALLAVVRTLEDVYRWADNRGGSSDRKEIVRAVRNIAGRALDYLPEHLKA